MDDDDVLGREVHFRAVCLSGSPSRPRDDDGAVCGEVKSQGRGYSLARAHTWTTSPLWPGYCSVSPTCGTRGHILTCTRPRGSGKRQKGVVRAKWLQPTEVKTYRL